MVEYVNIALRERAVRELAVAIKEIGTEQAVRILSWENISPLEWSDIALALVVCDLTSFFRSKPTFFPDGKGGYERDLPFEEVFINSDLNEGIEAKLF